jgi:tetrahydromethanopterin S-methyltransferase subunit D
VRRGAEAARGKGKDDDGGGGQCSEPVCCDELPHVPITLQHLFLPRDHLSQPGHTIPTISFVSMIVKSEAGVYDTDIIYSPNRIVDLMSLAIPRLWGHPTSKADQQ